MLYMLFPGADFSGRRHRAVIIRKHRGRFSVFSFFCVQSAATHINLLPVRDGKTAHAQIFAGKIADSAGNQGKSALHGQHRETTVCSPTFPSLPIWSHFRAKRLRKFCKFFVNKRCKERWREQLWSFGEAASRNGERCSPLRVVRRDGH